MFSAEHVCRKIANELIVTCTQLLTSSLSSSVLNVVFECGTWEGCDVRSSTLLSHRLLHVVHGRHRLLDHPTFRRANLAWRALPWCRRSSVRPPHDMKSPSHTVYTAPCHCQATLLSKLLQSSLNLHFLLSSPFFSTGALCLHHLISREYGKQRARASYPKNTGDYPMRIHHPRHVTVAVLMQPAA